MKKIILILSVIFLISNESEAQQEKQEISSTSYTLPKSNTVIKDNLSFNLSNDPGNGTVKDYAYYMQKKKNNLTAGLVTLGGGLLLSGIGLVIASNTSAFDNDASGPAIFLIAGAVSGIVSIPLMIMSSVYGHKAKLELSKQKTGFGVPSNVSKDIVGITLQIPLGK